MKLKHQTKKLLFPILTALATLAVGISISVNWSSEIWQNHQATNQASRIDPVQARVQKYMDAGTAVITPNNVGGGLVQEFHEQVLMMGRICQVMLD